MFRVTTHVSAPHARITVSGDVDLATDPQLFAALDHAVRSGCTEIECDLTGVTFLSLAGLRGLTVTQRRVSSSGGRLVVVAASPPVQRLLAFTGLEAVLTAPAAGYSPER